MRNEIDCLDDDALEGRGGDVAEVACQVLVVAGDGDHRGVVGGEDALGDEGAQAVATGIVLDGSTHATVGRDAAANGDGLDAGVLDGAAELVHKYLDDGALQRGGQVSLVLLDEVGVVLERVAQGVQEGRLQSAKTVVVTIHMRFGKFEGLAVALGGQAVDDGATGVGQSHDLGALVKCLARGVVNGLAQHLHVAGGVDLDNLAVAATDEQAQVGELRHRSLGVFLNEVGQHMAVQVVDIHQRYVERQSEPLGKRGADVERARQARAAREGDGVDVLAADARLADGLAHNGDNVLLVGPGCQFGDHATIGLMDLLAGNDITQQHGVAQHGSRRVVTR